MPAEGGQPGRVVHCADAIPWMQAAGCLRQTSAVTSLPDVSEVGRSLAFWCPWFIEAVGLVVTSVPPESVAVFFQSDIHHEGTWIDKGAMVVSAAESAGARVLFHKIVCRRPPGTITPGRPGFTHLIAVSRGLTLKAPVAIPDVIVDAGRVPWVRAMGIRAAAHAVRFVRDHTSSATIFDPFCGVGTVLAVANALGLDAVGVEQARRRAEQSRELRVRADEL